MFDSGRFRSRIFGLNPSTHQYLGHNHKPSSGRVDKAIVTESINPGLIPSQIKPGTIKIGIRGSAA